MGTMIGMDLMTAGSDTTSTTLLWSVLYLVLNPEVQEHCFQEINDNLGAGTVSLTDMSNLQFCQATIGQDKGTLQHCDLLYYILTSYTIFTLLYNILTSYRIF